MIRYLFFALPFALSLGVLTKVEIFPSVNIYLWDIISTLIVLFSFNQILKFLRKKNPLLILIYSFALIGVLGVLFNARNLFELFSSLSYLLRLGIYFAIYIPLVSLKKESHNIIKKLMLICGFLFILFGYVQYLYYPNLRNLYYLGWDDHLYRLFSTFLDPNFAGIFIVLIFLYFFGFKLKSFERVLGYLFILPSIFLTYSRSSMISGLVSFLLFLFLTGKKKIAIFSILVFVLVIILLPKNLGGEGVNLLRTYSAQARLEQYQYSIQIIKDNLFTGVGFNSLRFVSERYGFIDKSQVLTSHSAAGIPNSFLVIFATTGLIGLLLFSIFVYKLFKSVSKINNKNNSYILTSMLSAVLIDSFFENAILFSPIIIWIILSFGVLSRPKS